MRVLAVLYCYPPLLVPAAMCYLKLMAGLVRNDVDVEIVTISPDTFMSPVPIPPDESLTAVVPPGIRNHVIRSPETSFWVKAIKKYDESRRFSYRWLEPRKREWTFPALRYLRRRDLSQYDVLLTCGQPHANHLLGMELRKHCGLPWVAYFSDPWTESPYQAYPSERLRRYHLQLEDSVVRAADLVLFTCEEMKQLVVRSQAGLDENRAGVLPHAFVPEWYHVAQTWDAPLQKEPGKSPPRIRLLQTGSFYGPRTPEPLVQSLERISRQVSLDPLRIEIYGSMEQRHQDLIAQKGLDGVIGLHGFIPYLQTLKLMKEHDALLLIDAPLTTTSESVFLPSKLIDYLGSHMPVVAVTPEAGATARVVRETGGIVCPLEKPEELDRLLSRALQDGRIPGTTDPEKAAEYDYRQVGRSLAAMMGRLLAGPRAG